MTSKFKLYRNAAYFDDEPTHIDTYETRSEAKEALIRKAHNADLMYSDYKIKRVKKTK